MPVADRILHVGDVVILSDEPDCIVPAGTYTISTINDDGSFHVGGNTAVWSNRILSHIPKD